MLETGRQVVPKRKRIPGVVGGENAERERTLEKPGGEGEPRTKDSQSVKVESAR